MSILRRFKKCQSYLPYSWHFWVKIAIFALIRIFGGEGLISLSHVKSCADSKNVNLIYLTRDIFDISAIFGSILLFWVKNMIFITKFDGEFWRSLILCKKRCADSEKVRPIDHTPFCFFFQFVIVPSSFSDQVAWSWLWASSVFPLHSILLVDDLRMQGGIMPART